MAIATKEKPPLWSWAAARRLRLWLFVVASFLDDGQGFHFELAIIRFANLIISAHIRPGDVPVLVEHEMPRGRGN